MNNNGAIESDRGEGAGKSGGNTENNKQRRETVWGGSAGPQNKLSECIFKRMADYAIQSPSVGFTPREAVSIITSCEEMAADPAESTDCPAFVRRRDCSAAVASANRAAGSCQAVSTEFEAF